MIQVAIVGRTDTNAKNATTVPPVSPHDQGTKDRPLIKIQWGDPWQIKSGSRNDGANQRGAT